MAGGSLRRQGSPALANCASPDGLWKASQSVMPLLFNCMWINSAVATEVFNLVCFLYAICGGCSACAKNALC